MGTRMTKAAVRAWLLDYAWLGSKADQAAVVECILSQDAWKHIDALADNYAGAQWEPGPAAFSEGTEFALSTLYECHDGPHLSTCSMKGNG